MSGAFVVPKDPCLHWSMLLPKLGKEIFPNIGRKRIHYLFLGRNAIFHGLKALDIKAGEGILVPSYHCSAIVEPILRYGAAVKFYNVGLDLKPDLTDIEARIDGQTRAILAIHYFGFVQPTDEIRALCQRRQLYFIEDCAHVLTGQAVDGTVVGTSGDISVFSWRKFLPVYDGGQLVINNPNVVYDLEYETGGFLFSLKVAKNTIDKLTEDSVGDGSWLAASSALSRLVRGLLSSSNEVGPNALTVNNYGVEFDPASANIRMSKLSRRILRHTSITEVARKRRENYAVVSRAVRKMIGVSALYPELSPDTCPWVFPLLVHETNNLHLVLRARGIPATTWGGVIHESLGLEDFPAARFLYKNLVFLPIHQSMEEEHLSVMLDVVDKSLRRTFSD